MDSPKSNLTMLTVRVHFVNMDAKGTYTQRIDSDLRPMLEFLATEDGNSTVPRILRKLVVAAYVSKGMDPHTLKPKRKGGRK